MSDSEFSALSNKELHAKLLEYGLPNIPVTDSSRNVLIKKLLAAKTAQKIPGASQKRRETLHTSLPATKPGSSTSSRRRTVNSTSTTSPDIAGGHVVSVEKARKPTTSAEAVKQYTRRSLANVPLSKSSLVSTSHDQSYGAEPLSHASRNKRDSDTESVHSNRSSVSLSRSETVTTSYRQEIAPMPRHYEDDEEDYDDCDYEEEPMDVDDYYAGGNISGTSSNRTHHITPVYTDSSHLISEPFQSPRSDISRTADGYDVSYESQRGLFQNLLATSTKSPSEYSSPSNYRPTLNYSNHTGPSFLQPESSNPKRYSNIGHTTAHLDEYDAPPPQRRYTTSNYSQPKATPPRPVATSPAVAKPPKNVLYPSLHEFYPAPAASSSQIADDDLDDEESDTSSVELEESASSTAYYKPPFKPITKRPPIGVQNGSVEQSLFAFLKAVDDKYCLKQLFCIVVVAILAVYLCSIMWT